MALHDRLLAAYGPQGWWPGDSRFEIMVGAVLTQNAAWTNVERAIGALKKARVLSAPKMRELDESALARLIRPAGYYNVKARRLRALLDLLDSEGGEGALEKLSTADPRLRLLSVKGIGPETADDILLYGFHRSVFVIDAFTRRLFTRLGWIAGEEGYEVLREGMEQALGQGVGVMQELHALIVRHAKQSCRSNPQCERCILARRCGTGTKRYA